MEHTLAELLKPEQTRKSIKPYFANLTIGAGRSSRFVSFGSCAGATSAECCCGGYRYQLQWSMRGGDSAECLGNADRFRRITSGRIGVERLLGRVFAN